MEILKTKRVIGSITLVIRKPKNGYMTVDGTIKRISKILHTPT
jgi:hypothetical protein